VRVFNRSVLSGRSRVLRPLLLASMLCALFLSAACGGAGDSEGEGASFPERDIRFLVGVSPGGGFDTWARTLAPHLEEKLPGEGQVVVENLTGAGGLRAANTLYTAQPDGYTIGVTNTIGLAAAQVSGQADFDITEFTWIGRLTADPELLLVSADSEFRSMEDLQNADRQLRAAVTSLGASTGVGAILIGDAYGLDWTPVTHEGSSEATLSVVRGDTDFIVNSLDSALPDVEAGDLRPILGASQEPELEPLPDVPMAAEDGHEDLGTALSLARDIAAPPDLPEDVRNTLAQAFTEAIEDPEFLAEIEEAGYRPSPLNADETEAEVQEILGVYQGYEDLLKEALSER
jgi:tripartite-type tricarboxylate transporter receptor subunit TctC